MGVTGLFSKISSIAHPIYFPPLNHHFNQTQDTLPVRHPAPRVGIDISGWIAASCHGYGTTLLDERHLHHYGRTELWIQHQQHNNHSLLLQQEREAQCIDQVSQYMVRKLQFMRQLGMDLVVVLDGAVPPIKRKTSSERKRKREVAMEERDLLVQPIDDDDEDGSSSVDSHTRNQTRIRAAKKAGTQSYSLYSKIIHRVLQNLRRENVRFIVAPYESDGQLAFLSQQGWIDWVFSEDSDMIGHGVENLIYKLEELHTVQNKREVNKDDYTLESKMASGKLARGLLIQRSEYGASPSAFSLLGFTDVMIVVMIVAAGCDYCSNLHGIGLIKARNIVQDEFLKDREKPVLERVIQRLYAESSSKHVKPDMKDYIIQFIHAVIAFRHPIVFDPSTAQCLIKDIDSPDAELMAFKPYANIVLDRSAVEAIVGNVYCKEKAIAIAEGWLNPKSNQLWVEEDDAPESVLELLHKSQRGANLDDAHMEGMNTDHISPVKPVDDDAMNQERSDDPIESSNPTLYHQLETQDERGIHGIDSRRSWISQHNATNPCKDSPGYSSSFEDSPNLFFVTQAFSQSQSSSCTLSAGMLSSISP